VEAPIKKETPKEPPTKIGFRGLTWGDSVEKLKSKNLNIK
jgi:hypothetical protein